MWLYINFWSCGIRLGLNLIISGCCYLIKCVYTYSMCWIFFFFFSLFVCSFSLFPHVHLNDVSFSPSFLLPQLTFQLFFLLNKHDATLDICIVQIFETLFGMRIFHCHCKCIKIKSIFTSWILETSEFTEQTKCISTDIVFFFSSLFLSSFFSISMKLWSKNFFI